MDERPPHSGVRRRRAEPACNPRVRLTAGEVGPFTGIEERWADRSGSSGYSFSRRLLVHEDRHLARGRRCEPSSAFTLLLLRRLCVERPRDSASNGPPYPRWEGGTRSARGKGARRREALHGAARSYGRRFRAKTVRGASKRPNRLRSSRLMFAIFFTETADRASSEPSAPRFRQRVP